MKTMPFFHHVQKQKITVDPFCMMCGTQLVPGKRFCVECGAGIAEPGSTSAPAPSVVLEHTVTTKKPLPAWLGVLISVGLLLVMIAFIAALDDAESAKGLIGLIALGTAVWASIDASRIGLKRYRTGFAKGSAGVFFVWLIVFPLSCGWYLVVRSRIRAGVMPKREPAVVLQQPITATQSAALERNVSSSESLS